MPIERQTLEIINMIATCVSAIGTLAAVFTALYLSLSERQLKVLVKPDVGHVYTARFDYKILSLDIINVGIRSVIIKGIRIRLGIFNRKYFAFFHPESGIIDLPKQLNDGETLEIAIPMKDFEDSFPDLYKKYPLTFSYVGRRFMRFVITSSTGEVFVGKPRKALRKRIEMMCKNV